MKQFVLILTCAALLAGCGAQRGLPGTPTPIGAASDALARKKKPASGELARVAAWVAANSGGSYWDEPKKKLFPAPDDGNNGTTTRVYAGEKGAWLAGLTEAWTRKSRQPVKVGFDPRRHYMIGVDLSEDEPVTLVALFDRTTDKGRPLDELTWVDLAYHLDQAAFERFFPRLGNVRDVDFWKAFESLAEQGEVLAV